MVEAVVEFDYEGKEDDELTLKVGDVITNVDKQSGGWWEGVLNGKKGVFPDNFVKEIKKDVKESATASPAAKQKHVSELANKLGNINIMPGNSPGAAPNVIKRASEKSSIKQKTAKVTFAYSPQNDDELRLDVGDIVEILKQEEEGWWQGSHNGKTGVFPSNFVELIEDTPAAAAAADESDGSASKASIHEIKGKKIKGIGLGNIFGNDGPRLQLKTPDQAKEPLAAARHDLTPNDKVPTPTIAAVTDNKAKKTTPPQVLRNHTNVPTLPPKDKKLERARVLYSYSAENEDELSLEEGDVITILEKELEDSGWWRGELRGKQGVFPDNFVELLPPEEPAKPKKPPPPAVSVVQPQPIRPAAPEPKPEPKPEAPRMQPKPSDKSHSKVPLSKKPSLPPPVGKKPLPKPDEPVTDDQKAGHHGETPSEGTLDAVESAQRLSHLNNNRPPGPKDRRMPTNPKTLAQDGKEEIKVAPKKPAQPPQHAPPPLHPAPPVPQAAPEPVKEEPAPVVVVAAAAAPPVAPVQVIPSAELEELRADIKWLKENSVSQSKFEEMQKEVVAAKEEVSGMKEQLRKRTIELMTEVDEEKKVRLSMQVELDRLKRLVMA